MLLVCFQFRPGNSKNTTWWYGKWYVHSYYTTSRLGYKIIFLTLIWYAFPCSSISTFPFFSFFFCTITCGIWMLNMIFYINLLINLAEEVLFKLANISKTFWRTFGLRWSVWINVIFVLRYDFMSKKSQIFVSSSFGERLKIWIALMLVILQFRS